MRKFKSDITREKFVVKHFLTYSNVQLSQQTGFSLEQIRTILETNGISRTDAYEIKNIADYLPQLSKDKMKQANNEWQSKFKY